ncbi:MAG: rRNA maturation RNase YbeY [Pseudomonadota bacterium]|nr:rRNA maturation RNase YbeY [Pseudomonadota bacterium]
MGVSVTREGVKHPARPVSTDARALLKHLGMPKAELSILLCDDEFIRGLNAQWRQKDEPTDVLSFAMGEGDDADLNPDVLGDIVISVETAARQAAALGLTLDQEMRVLLVHGLLHLLGYDHVEPEDAPEMRAREAELLTALGGGTGLVDRAHGDDAGVVEPGGAG